MLALAATHAFWITSRAAGVAALLASSASVSVGLTMGGRLLPRAQRVLRPLHEALSLAALSALAWLASLVHALGMGTDAGSAWFLVAVGIAIVPALTLLVVRLTEEREAAWT